MRNKFKYIVFVTIGMITFIQTNSTGQFFINPTGGTNWKIDNANYTVDKVSLSTATTYPYAFYIDGANLNTTTGDVFGTNAPSGTNATTYWRMLMAGTEYGALFHLGSASNFTLQASRNHLNLNSGYNGTGLEALRIVGGNGSNARFVGIGDYSSSKFYEAQNQLQQFITGNSNVYHQFTNGNTTASTATTASEGFKIGLTYNSGVSDAELISQQSGANMNFYTNIGSTLKRMTILSGDNVGVNIAAPTAQLHVYADGYKAIALKSENIQSASIGSTVEGLHITSTAASAGTDASKGMVLTASGHGNVFGTQISASSTSTSSFTYGIVNDVSGTNPQNYGIIGTVAGTAAINTGIGYTITPSGAAANKGVKLVIADASNGVNDGVDIHINNANGAGTNTGVNINIDNSSSTSGTNTGGSFISNGGLISYGVSASGTSNNSGTGSSCGGDFTGTGGFNNYGGRMVGTSGNTAYGLYAAASGASGYNYGVYAVAASVTTGTTTTINVGNPANAAGFFGGDVVTNASYWNASDGMLKTNVLPLNGASSIIAQLEPKSYYYDTVQFPQMNFPTSLQYGLLAQDLQNVLPQFVKPMVQPEEKDTSGNVIHQEVDFLAVTYQPLITLLIASNKEMQQQITDLQNQMANINNGQMKQSNVNNQLKVELGNSDKIIYLSQNIPNPFVDNTKISFMIPTDVKSASIMFSDDKGSVIKTVEISSRGENSLMVFGENLSKGVYSYTLIVDNKVATSKRMVKQ